jgi:hypothetical protein
MESDNFDFEISYLGYKIKGPSMDFVASFGAICLWVLPARLGTCGDVI